MRVTNEGSLRFLVVAAVISVVLPFLVLAPLSPPVHLQSEPTQIASIKVVKSIPEVSADNKVTVLLTIKNNGSVPEYDFEVFEYVNPKLQAAGDALIVQPSVSSHWPMSYGGVSTASQVIIDPPTPNALNAGQQMTITYSQLAPTAGDFQIPAALVWFTYKLGGTTIRSNIYSNGLILHVPNAIEKAFVLIYPYVLSIIAFAATMTVLLWARGRLGSLKRKAEAQAAGAILAVEFPSELARDSTILFGSSPSTRIIP